MSSTKYRLRRDFDPAPRRGPSATGRLGSMGHNRFGKPIPSPGWDKRVTSWLQNESQRMPMQWVTSKGEPRCVRCGERLVLTELAVGNLPACGPCRETVDKHLESL